MIWINPHELNQPASFTLPVPDEAELGDLAFAAIGAVILIGCLLLAVLS